MTVLATRNRANAILATAAVLALLYFARDVLVPVTLAVILSLLVAPLVRVLRRAGLGQTGSVLAAVFALAAFFALAVAMIGLQLAKMTSSLPMYEERIRQKLAALDGLTAGQLNAVTAALQHPVSAGGPVPVEIRTPPLSAIELVQRVLGTVWGPLATAGIVFVVLVFVLLERESLRDRFIRIAGVGDIHATSLALNDAGERLSRYFVSQLLVNVGVGCALGLGLWLLGLPLAFFWGTLAGLLRFVPYVGVWIAALFAAMLGAAIDPGWSLAIGTLSLVAAVELIASQLVEPQLYGHATGLSPLSVVVSAVFWSWLWGPIGLLVSTPLTLCLVVAGRHIETLSSLDVLLGDHHALTMAQRFYQRALSGDSEEIISSAHAYLEHSSLAEYCDEVLIPALVLTRASRNFGSITPEQQATVRDAIVSSIAAIARGDRKQPRRRRRTTVLDPASLGRQLRTEREQLVGPFQGPLIVAPGTVMLCAGMGTPPDSLGAELLVRILREQGADARHLSLDELLGAPPAQTSPNAVALVYLVSSFPSEERNRAAPALEQLRQKFSGASLITMFLRGDGPLDQAIGSVPGADESTVSFREAAHVFHALQHRNI